MWILLKLKLCKWSTPKSVTEIHSFLGLASYYHRFVEGFARLAASLTALIRKGKKFELSQSCEDNFQELKRHLTSASVLIIPNVEEEIFVIFNDAS